MSVESFYIFKVLHNEIFWERESYQVYFKIALYKFFDKFFFFLFDISFWFDFFKNEFFNLCLKTYFSIVGFGKEKTSKEWKLSEKREDTDDT